MQITKDELRQIINEAVNTAIERFLNVPLTHSTHLQDGSPYHATFASSIPPGTYQINPHVEDTPEQPRFKHDCDRDVFLGHYDGADLYFADHGGLASNWEPQHSTIIARWSDYEPDYMSGIAFADVDDPNPHIAEGLRRALARGLLKRKEP